MRSTVALLLAALTLGACNGRSPSARPARAGPVTLTVRGTPLTETRGSQLRRRLADRFTQRTGIHVTFVPGMIEPSSSELDQNRRLLESRAATPDIYQIDIVWAGALAEHLLDLQPYLAAEAKQHLPAIVENSTAEGRLVSLSYFVDVGLLYFRRDLLRKYGYERPPATWDALEEAAARIQAGERAAGKKDFWGFVWQGAAYEGLTCNALEWQVSHGGGRMIELHKTITVNNPRTRAAFERAARWVGTISPPGVVAYREEDARNVWQSGNAAFMRNWPYAHALGQAPDSAIRDRFEVTLLPAGEGGRASTLGGWQLAVSKYSHHPREAAEFVRFMTSREVQLRRLVEGSYLPVLTELYRHPPVIETQPHYQRLHQLFPGGVVARPSTVAGASYDDVSRAYFTHVHRVLTGEARAAAALRNIEAEIVALTGFKAGFSDGR